MKKRDRESDEDHKERIKKMELIEKKIKDYANEITRSVTYA